MKKNRLIFNRNDKGITLVALVITIIVLLILAGVTISMVVGENGILTRVKQANFEKIRAETEEKLQMALVELIFDIQELNLNGNNTYSLRDMRTCFKRNLNVEDDDSLEPDDTTEELWLIKTTCDGDTWTLHGQLDESAGEPAISNTSGDAELEFYVTSSALRNAAKSSWVSGTADGILRYKVEIKNWKVGGITDLDDADNTGGY